MDRPVPSPSTAIDSKQVNGKVRGLRIIVRDGVHLKEKGHGSPDGPAGAITMPRMSVRVHGFALRGIEAVPCEVEVDLSGQGQ
jgi:hypothetical protein